MAAQAVAPGAGAPRQSEDKKWLAATETPHADWHCQVKPERPEEKLCCGCIQCTPCRWCCCIGCGFAVCTAILVVVIVMATFTQPEVSVTKAVIRDVTPIGTPVPSGVTFTVDLTFHLKNPNGPPTRIDLTEFTAEIFSLDKAASDQVGQPYFLGNVALQDELILEPKTATDFTITVMFSLTASQGQVDITQRILRDCGPTAPVNADGNTVAMLRIHPLTASVKAKGRNIDVPVDGIKIDTLVPCGGPGALPGGTGGGASSLLR